MIIIGVITLLIPLSGLPIAPRSFLTLVSGASVLGIGLAMRRSAHTPVVAPLSEETAASVDHEAPHAPTHPSAI